MERLSRGRKARGGEETENGAGVDHSVGGVMTN